MLALLRRSLGDERGVAAAEVDDDALEFLAARSGGDARTALSALELACETAGERRRGDAARGRGRAPAQRVLYDKGGDRHYDLISAWIKATRGSDPDASLLYLAAMLEGGEDPRFIARRMVVLASEDIGNADPQALEVAVDAAHAVEHVGHARVRAQPRPGGDLPGAGAEVQRVVPRRSARAREWVREHGASRPPRCADAAYPGARSSAAGGLRVPARPARGRLRQELMPEGPSASASSS